jgi:hypothetical protein
MGYTITIGQLEINKSPDDGLDCSCIRFCAAGASHENAPAFGEPTDHTNSRWPSYCVWPDFLRDAGLYDVFYYDSGHLIGGHPGVRLVTLELVEKVDFALSSFKLNNPEIEAKFGDDEKGGTLCRLIWLQYWVKWAFENCEAPVIANS